MPHPHRRVFRAASLAVLCVALLGCDSWPGGPVPTAGSSSCVDRMDVPPPPPATDLEGGGDATVTSFDGTPIEVHLFLAPGASVDAPAPTVLVGAGWASAGDTNTAPDSIVGRLLARGYDVVTWDPRGFGRSGGVSEVDSPAYEGRDVQELLSWLATRPEVQLDGPGDPRVGVVGSSYGGEVALVAAAVDCRVDAVVPAMAWSSLQTSLAKGGILKQGWANLLRLGARSGQVDPRLEAAYQDATTRGSLTADDEAWLAASGLDGLAGRIEAPTLFVQGTYDTLFTLDEAVRNQRVLLADGVPTAMVWPCGGHGFCGADSMAQGGGAPEVAAASLAWLDRYVRRDPSVDPIPALQVVDQHGAVHRWDTTPELAGSVTAEGSGSLDLTAAVTSGPVVPAPSNTDRLAAWFGPITAAPAVGGVVLPIDTGTDGGLILGASELTLDYSGSSVDPDRPQAPTAVFAQLVDDATGEVVGHQVTPVPLVLDGEAHQVSVPMEMVAYAADPGAHLTLQLVPTTVAYATPQLGGHVTFDHIRVQLPIVAG